MITAAIHESCVKSLSCSTNISWSKVDAILHTTPRIVNNISLHSVPNDIPVKLRAAPAKQVKITATYAPRGAFASNTLLFSKPIFKSTAKIGKARKF